MRAAIYARYSSDNQSDSSIEDQVRICKARIVREGWKVHAIFSDRAISGAKLLRPGYQDMLQAVRSGKVDVVVAEALDRVSRDQEHVAAFFKQISFAGAKLVTISEGEISELHVGLKGTMNALFLKDLATKTHRGLEGRVREGKSAGGRAYGYLVVRKLDTAGALVTGEREINQAEAQVVRRIFKMFAGGASPRAIAALLNKERVKGPDGRRWSESTIRGHGGRRTGILRNDLYNGKLVWNKQRYVKDPVSGRRLARINPKDQWIWKDASGLRVVEAMLWKTVQDRLDAIAHSPRVTKAKAAKFWEHRRPRHLLTGIATCGHCGEPLSSIGSDYLACSSARRTGTCSARKSIRRSILEDAVLGVLRDQLLQPDLVKEFAREFQKEFNARAAEAGTQQRAAEQRLRKIEKQIEGLVDSLANGMRSEAIKVRLMALEAEQSSLKRQESRLAPTPLRIHPSLPDLYQAKIQNLAKALDDAEIRDEAIATIRDLLEEVRVTVTEQSVVAEIKGEIGRMTNLALGRPAEPSSVKVVAGVGFEPTTFRL